MSATSAASFADTVIVSDIHLGLPASRPDELLQFLEAASFRRLILLGDVFNDEHFHHLCEDAHQLLAYLREITTRGLAELVWINGNHDRQLSNTVFGLIGVQGREHYDWVSGGKRYLALHGDRFDVSAVRENHLLPAFLSWLSSWCQRRAGIDYCLIERLEFLHNRVGGLAERMLHGATRLAKEHACDAVICGHTHRAEHRSVSSEDVAVDYVNAGAWVGRPRHFVTVTDGVVRLNCHA